MNRRYFLMSFEVRHGLSGREAGIGELPRGTNGYFTIESYDRPAKIEAGNNWSNFIDALRSRDKTKLNGPIEEGALSVALLRLANISYELGRSLNINPATGDAIGDPEALRLYRRQQYRAPFIVPEKV